MAEVSIERGCRGVKENLLRDLYIRVPMAFTGPLLERRNR